MASLEAPRRITELDAVNIILHNAGEETVITFGPNSKPSAQKAKEMLAEESIRLQSDGYNFCTSRNLRLSPNSSGKYSSPITSFPSNQQDRPHGWTFRKRATDFTMRPMTPYGSTPRYLLRRYWLAHSQTSHSPHGG
ncbi:hypothetical protein HGG76_02510 [Ochrobactrum tritici]|uniref:Uncharacterized protein n=1 Tax=Brucella tritici TaxID=94626 RepID=A0A7X6J9P9_9HYPH|nr:hypothetical protein [Brucella tritici]